MGGGRRAGERWLGVGCGVLMAWGLTACLETSRGGDDRQLEANLYRGESYLKKGDAELALPPLRKAYEMAPDHIEVLSLLGVAYDLAGSHDQAAKLLRRAVAQRPTDGGLLDALGVAEFHLGRLAEAEASFQSALEDKKWKSPEEAHFHLAMVYRQQGKEEEQLAMLGQCLALNPMHQGANLEMATHHRSKKRFDQEQRYLVILLTEQPDNLVVLDRLAASYLGSGHGDRAVPLLRKIIEVAPQSVPADEARKRLANPALLPKRAPGG